MFDKPKSVNFELSDLKPRELEYFCKTGEIDKEIMKALNLPFDQQLSDFMSEKAGFYFVVDKNRRYDVVSSVKFDNWLKENKISLDQNKTPKAAACINHFVKFCVKQYKDAENKNALGLKIKAALKNNIVN